MEAPILLPSFPQMILKSQALKQMEQMALKVLTEALLVMAAVAVVMVVHKKQIIHL